MRAIKTVSLLLLLSLSLAVCAENAENKANSNTPCEQVLQNKSSEWIKLYEQQNGKNTLETVKAIFQYENCYTKKLDQLHADLNKTEHYPLMGAMGNFRDLQSAMKDFTQRAIQACGQTGDRVRLQRAYATLYQLQFKKYFLDQYQKGYKKPKDDPEQIVQARAKLNDVFKKLNKQDSTELQNSFNKFRQVAMEGNAMPEIAVYNYALMVLSKDGPIISGEPSF